MRVALQLELEEQYFCKFHSVQKAALDGTLWLNAVKKNVGTHETVFSCMGNKSSCYVQAPSSLVGELSENIELELRL